MNWNMMMLTAMTRTAALSIEKQKSACSMKVVELIQS